jgi:hypothetical protein
MNRTADEIITAMEFCALNGGASAFLIGDNEMARLVTEWRAMKTRCLSSDLDKLEAAIIAAYERGAAWTTENPNSSEYVKKAARDYADKITSPMNT